MDQLDTSSLNTGTQGFDLPVKPINKEVSSSDLVGTYRFGDGFWNWEIHLEEDMTFAHVWISDTLIEDDEGKIGFESGVDIDGQWSLERDAVRLSYERNETYRLVRVGKHLSLVEPILRSDFHRVYVKTDSPLTFRKKEEPNQAAHTTPAIAPR